MMEMFRFISKTKLGFLLFVVVLYLNESVQQVPNGRRYVGCWGDSFQRTLPDYNCNRQVKDQCPECAGPGENSPAGTGFACQNGQMTIEICVDLCSDEGLTFAGLQSGTECFCGDENAPFQKFLRNESMCNTPCAGNPTQTCGGSFWSSVYDIRKSCTVENLNQNIFSSEPVRYDDEFVIFDEGDSLTFTCQTGYSLQGQPTAVCQSDGSFSPPIPSCVAPANLSPVTCPPQPPLVNGIIQPQQTIFRQGETARFFCRSGFVLQGSNQLTCGANGQWNGNSPNCTEMRCDLPPSISSASWVLNDVTTTVGVSAVYTCIDGFSSSIESSSRVCNENFQWEDRGSTLTCLKDDLPDGGNLPVDEGGGNTNQTTGVPALLWILIVIVIICLIIFLAGCIIMRSGSSSGPRDYKQRDPYITDGVVVTREGNPGKSQAPNNTAFVVPPPHRHTDPEVGIPAENYSSRATSIASGTLRDNKGFNLTAAEADKYIDSLFDIDGVEETGNTQNDDVVGPYHPTMGGFSGPPRQPSPHHHPESDDYPPPPTSDPHYHDLERERPDTPPQQSIYGYNVDEMDLPAHAGPSGSTSRAMYLPPANDYPSVSNPENSPSPSPSEDKSTQNPEKYFLDEVDEFFDGVNEKIDNCMMQ